MLKMPRQTGAFPPVNNLLQKKWNARAYKQHLEKRKSMTTSLNTKKPKSYLHLQLNLKKIQLEEERQEAIDHENRILLAKLTKVIRSAGELDNWNEEYDDLPKTLNRRHMLKELERIEAENEKISRRLGNTTAEYNIDQWEDEYLLHEYYLTLKAQETKSFEVEARGFEEDSCEPHYYNKDQEVARSFEQSIHPSDCGRIEPDEQNDHLSTSPSNTSKVKQSKKPTGAFQRPKPQPRLPLLGQSRKREEEKRKREAASKPAPYDVKEDAARLFKAAKGMAKAVELVFIQTLARRTYTQRQQTKDIFEAHYELDLEVELIEILGEEWTDLISTLLAKREVIDAGALQQSLKGKLPMTDTIIGLLCTRNNSAISIIKKAYVEEFDTQLVLDIREGTKGQLRHLFLTLAKGTRMEDSKIDIDRAKQDAEVLKSEPEVERWKAETGKMAELLRIASFSQIREVFEQYDELSDSKVLDEMQEFLAGDYREAMQAMVKCLNHCAMYMAERLRTQLVKKNSTSLIRLLVTRSEIDLPQIRKAYRQRYGETLMDAIEAMCKEPYKKALINMVLVHGSAANQQDQQEAETKVPSLPKVASPTNKTKPLRRPSPNKMATLSSANPLVKSVKAAQQQQQPPPGKESILMSRRTGAVPKKTVTVTDPRAKHTPLSGGRRPSGNRPTPTKTKKPSVTSLDKSLRKSSGEKKERTSDTQETLKTDMKASDAMAVQATEVSGSKLGADKDGDLTREKPTDDKENIVEPDMARIASGENSASEERTEASSSDNVPLTADIAQLSIVPTEEMPPSQEMSEEPGSKYPGDNEKQVGDILEASMPSTGTAGNEQNTQVP